MDRKKLKEVLQQKQKKIPPVLTKALIEEFKIFIEYHPAERFGRNLRKMLIEFLMHEGSTEADYLKDLLWDIEGLYNLFDAIQEETQRRI